MNRKISKLALALGLAALSACAPATGIVQTEDVLVADAPEAVRDAASPRDAMGTHDTMSDAPSGDYPAGPFGNTVGATLANLELDGFVNDSRAEVSTRAPFVSYSLATLRAGGARYALVHTGGFL